MRTAPPHPFSSHPHKLTPAQQAVLVALGAVEPPSERTNQITLAKSAGCSRMTVYTALRVMERLGLIIRVSTPAPRGRIRQAWVQLYTPQPEQLYTPRSEEVYSRCFRDKSKSQEDKNNCSSSIFGSYDIGGEMVPKKKGKPSPTSEQLQMPLLGVATIPPKPEPERFPLPDGLAGQLAEYWRAMAPDTEPPFSIFGMWYRQFKDADFILGIVKEVALRGAALRVDKLTGYVYVALKREFKAAREQHLQPGRPTRQQAKDHFQERVNPSVKVDLHAMTQEELKAHYFGPKRPAMTAEEVQALYGKGAKRPAAMTDEELRAGFKRDREQPTRRQGEGV